MNSDGKYTPLNLNCLGSLIQNTGLRINPKAAAFMGASTSISNYTITDGSLVNDTVLHPLSNATTIAWAKVVSSDISPTTYANLISIGSATIPALGNSKPTTYTKTYSNQLASYGWLRLIALQAYNEFYINNGSYFDFLGTFNSCYSLMKQSNVPIQAYVDSLTYLDGMYSNMNDLITSDITGVSLSTFYWGQDLIASGKAIDLTNIDTFGNPDNLLRTLHKYKAINKSVNLALLTAGINAEIIDNVIKNNPITFQQQQSIYAAFCLIVDNDLVDVLIPINCQTKGLQSLADLLDPKKLFPNSYQTLTVPVYNTAPGPTNSKTYYLLYTGDQINMIGDTYGARLNQVLPYDLAYVCDAFGTSMMQIKNIKSMMIEKFSQVVTNLENVSDLNVNGTSKPTDTATATAALTAIALGSGENGKYTMCDYFGSMTDLHYDWYELKLQINALTSNYLITCYNNILTTLQSTNYTPLQGWIDDANSEISRIFDANFEKGKELNVLYNTFGTHLLKEQNARELALPNITSLAASIRDMYGFIGLLNQYSIETEQKGPAQVLESISDITTLGGNSLIGSMREIRNAYRLGLTGAEQDNSVSNIPLTLPKKTESVPTSPADPTQLLVTEGPLVGVVAITGAATTPGSLAGSQETTLIPTNLDVFNIANTPLLPSVINPKDAVQSVIDCNCDCWDLLTN
jgi:hypothetical protein